MNFPAVIFDVPGRIWGPTTTTQPGWYYIIMMIALLQDLFWVPAAQDGSNLVSWNGALFTMFWTDLLIGRSEKPYQILRDYLQLYQTVILELNHHFTFTGSHRKNLAPMTAGNNSKRLHPLSQQSLSSGLRTSFRGWLYLV